MNATAKKGFKNPLDFVRAANDVPESTVAVEDAAEHVAPVGTKQTEPAVAEATQAAIATAEASERPSVPAPLPSRLRGASKPANVRFPEELHNELREFWKKTDIPMSEVIIEGTRARLAELKKLYGVK